MEGNAAVFREKELRKYLKKMDPKGWEEADIRLLTSQREGLRERIQIDVRAGKGTIAGNGEGALLLGIYRFLYHLGCRFIRPGEDGERIPRLRREEWTVICKEEADFPHRGAVIEGADSLEHVLDYIDWLPKIGMNSFFTQFTDFRLFFERYYSHIHNPEESRRRWMISDTGRWKGRYMSISASVGCVTMPWDMAGPASVWEFPDATGIR